MTPTFTDLVDRARALTGRGHRAVLGITGAPAAGKSTLAENLVRALGAAVAHVPMDGFHLADAELDRLGRRDRKGAPDTFDALGYAALLRRLRDDEDDVVYAPGFERVIEQPFAGAIPAHLRLQHGGFDARPYRRLRVADAVRTAACLRRRNAFAPTARAASRAS